MLGNKIKKLRKNKGLTQQELANAIDVSRSTIGMLEKNLQGIGNENLIKLANFFNVSFDFISGNSEVDTCPVCGAHYCPLEKEDFDIHKIRHNNFLNFPERDLFLTYSNREVVKRKCYETLEDDKTTVSEKVDSAVTLYQCWFSRSIESRDFDSNHPSFNEYIAMMLNRNNSKEDLSEPVYDLLVQKYGLKEGISNGDSYATIKTANNENTDKALLLTNFKKLNDLGKKKLIEYSNDLMESSKYVVSKN